MQMQFYVPRFASQIKSQTGESTPIRHSGNDYAANMV
jgi:hypothetical protein